MALNRNTGLAMGLGIGLVISVAIFGVMTFANRRSAAQLAKARALPGMENATRAAIEDVSKLIPQIFPGSETAPTEPASLLERLDAGGGE